MSILRLLPLAASVDALRLEVQAAEDFPLARASFTHTVTKDSVTYNKENFMTGVSKDVIGAYQASQTQFISALTEQILEKKPWSRDACLNELRVELAYQPAHENSMVAYEKSLLDRAIDALQTGTPTEATTAMINLSSKRLHDIFKKTYVNNGYPLPSPFKRDFCLCNGLQGIYQLGQGEVKQTKSELLLRCFYEDDESNWRTGLAVVFGPAMPALQLLNFVDAMYLYGLNLHDANLLAISTCETAQKALETATINMSVNMLKYDEEGFFCSLANKYGFQFLEITEKNAGFKKNTLPLASMPVIPGVSYLLDDYEAPVVEDVDENLRAGVARHPGQLLLADRPTGLKASMAMTGAFCRDLKANKANLLDYIRTGDAAKGRLLNFEVRAFVNAVRTHEQVSELIFEGMLNAEKGGACSEITTVVATNFVELFTAFTTLRPTIIISQQGGNIPECSHLVKDMACTGIETPHPVAKGAELPQEQAAWNALMTKTQQRKDIIHNGVVGAQAEMVVFYGIQQGIARYTPVADAILARPF